jgi:anti-anti-sigma factor
MTFPVERHGSVALVALEGEIDLDNAARVREGLFGALAPGLELLVVDLDKVTFLPSVGLTILAMLAEEARGRGMAVRILACTRIVLRPLQITGLDEEIEVFASRASAIGLHAGVAEDGPGNIR